MFIVPFIVLLISSVITAENPSLRSSSSSWKHDYEVKELEEIETLKALIPSTHKLMSYTNMHRLPTVEYLGQPSKMQTHEVIFAVQHRNFDWLEEFVYSVSDPSSVSYGKHLSKDEIMEKVGNRESTEFVKKFVEEQGLTVTEVSHYGEFITVSGSVEQFEHLFQTEFGSYAVIHETSQKEQIVRAKHYALPLTLSSHVDAVFNTVQFPAPVSDPQNVQKEASKKLAKKIKSQSKMFSAKKGGQDGYTYPQLLNSYYCIPSNTGNTLTTQAVYGALNQTMSPNDLSYFQNYFDLPVQAISGNTQGHVSNQACYAGNEDCSEANLDIQYIMGMAQSVPSYYNYWGGNTWSAWIISVAQMTNPYDVISISYSSYENEVSADEKTIFLQQAIILAAAGTTLIAASGDDGVAGFRARAGTFPCGCGISFPQILVLILAFFVDTSPSFQLPVLTLQQ
jgi:tripeptidyl-peptidase-1